MKYTIETTKEQDKAVEILGTNVEKYLQKKLNKLIPRAKLKWVKPKTLAQIESLE